MLTLDWKELPNYAVVKITYLWCSAIGSSSPIWESTRGLSLSLLLSSSAKWRKTNVSTLSFVLIYYNFINHVQQMLILILNRLCSASKRHKPGRCFQCGSDNWFLVSMMVHTDYTWQNGVQPSEQTSEHDSRKFLDCVAKGGKTLNVRTSILWDEVLNWRRRGNQAKQ